MRLLEYVEIRDERGEPVVGQGALEAIDQRNLVRLHEGIRIYTRSSARQAPYGMRATTLMSLLPQIPRVLSELITHDLSLRAHAYSSDSIVGFYKAHLSSSDGMFLLKEDTINHFAAMRGDARDLLLEVDASNKTIESFVKQFRSLMQTTFPTSQREDASDEADDEGAGWPSDLPASVAKRKELLAEGWPTSKEVAAYLGSTAENKAQQAAAFRQAGKLLGVRDGAHGFRHPLCQFQRGELIEEVEELLRILPPGNRSGWSQTFWLYSPHPLLDGRRPADVLSVSPHQVIEIAKRQFEATEHASW
ncbi:hypothetical protein [Xanthomonas campestris]|uniref:hypothetical protein n=1 Tax=Xanthomonas campestris TaxID=339 RepID=UPI002B23A045|nr:hypothetical protein [Xanthomonas campestris]MEA9731869.1 hypothetical protein [Xanthomonas campestris]